jgi:hypothetical protein
MTYSSYFLLTSALNGDERLASRFSRALRLGKDPRHPLDRRLDGPDLVWAQRLQEKSFASAGDRTLGIQSVIRHYTD